MENYVGESGFAPLNKTVFTRDQEQMKEENFPFQVVDQSKPTSFLQDFQHLDHDHQFDHHHHHHGSTSSNPLLGIQTRPSCVNSSLFEHCAYQDNMVNMITKPMNFVMPDEVSCVSADNDCYKSMSFNKTKPILTRKLSSSSSSSSWKEKKETTLVKGQWTSEEDRIVIQFVEKYGLRKWSHIAQVLPGRIGKQCRERWHNHLRPDIKKETWSEEEDRVLIQFHKEIGNKWAEIAKRLPGRTENSIKNHWNATKRRQFSKRKCRSKYPRPSLLQDYIKSLDLKALSFSSKKDFVAVEEENKKNEDDLYGLDRMVPECVFTDDFGFNEKLLVEGCSIDSLLDDLPQPDTDTFAHGF
ncbi:hypothetical protein Bca52824_092420 [Brassica carinata]|uniref:Uncharacterized protein n=1 Tax=Brassica carinata TaxID=52824 RepID=A0A8X7TE29_BRACI|nr:hypothetical protein Bca52824_092420 [Brassica carinata]